MLFEGKRGLAKRELPQIILALVVALSIFGPFIKTTDVAAATIDVEKCRLNTVMASIEAGWDMKIFRTDAPNPFYMDCPKRYVYVSNDNIKVSNVNTKLATDSDEKREQQLKDFILSEMTKCWKSYGGASDTVYSANTGIGENNIDASEETACFSCSEVFFDDEFEPVTITDKDFYDYANDKSMIIGDQSYVKFLTGGNAPPDLPKSFGKDDKITLEANQQWSTIFAIKKIKVGGVNDNLDWVPFKECVEKPPADGGILDCSVVNEKGDFEGIDNTLAYSIGCSSSGCTKDCKKPDECKNAELPTIKGFVFGKIARGYYTLFDNRVDWNTGNAVRFPMTVRFVPTANVFGSGPEKCERLY